MKALFLIVLIAPICVCALAQERVHDLECLPAVWRNAGPGGGGYLPSMLLSRHAHGRAWIGCDVGGVFRSDDAGRSWKVLNHGVGNLYIEAICEHPLDDNVVLLGSRGGIFKTDNGGERWRPVRQGLPKEMPHGFSVHIAQVVSVPGYPDAFLAMTGKKGIALAKLYRSDDCGETWLQIVADGQFPEKTFFRSISVDPRDGRKILLSTSCGLYRSEDGGCTWTPSGAGLCHDRTSLVARSPSNPDVIYLSMTHLPGETPWRSVPHRSVDGGRTWKPCGLDGLETVAGTPDVNIGYTSSYKCIAVHPERPDEVYLCGETWRCEGVWKSVDGGSSWRHVFGKPDIVSAAAWLNRWGPDIHSLSISPFPPYAMMFGTEGHAFRSDGGGERWTQCYTDDSVPGIGATVGLETTCLNSIAPDPHHIGRIYFNYMDIGCQRSDDGGRTFRWCMRGIEYNDCFAIQFDEHVPDRMWGSFGQWAGPKGYLAESTDGGLSWRPIDGTGWGECKANGFAVFSHGTQATICAAVKGRGLLVSRNDGANWLEVSTNIFALARHSRAVRKLEGKLHLVAEDRLYEFTPEVGFRCIFDKPVGMLMGYARKGDCILVCARERWTGMSLLPGGAFLSRDGGANWKRVYRDPYVVTGLFADGWIIISPYDNPYHDRDNGGGVVVSRDGGQTWKTLNSPTLFNWNLNCYAIDPFRPSVLWAGSHGNSAFVTDLSDLAN